MTVEHNSLTGAALHNSKILTFTGDPASYTPPESGIIVCCLTSPNAGKLYRTTGTTAGAVTLLAAGVDGAAATISIGDVETLDPGEPAYATDVGTANAAVINLGFPKGDPGAGINPRGAYNAGTAYAIGDSVSYSGSSYVAIAATTGNLPTNASFWQLLAEKGTTGTDGKTVRNGSGAPSSGLGVDGDFYIDTTADAIYGPKTAGAWGSSTPIIGTNGTNGAGYGGTSPTSLSISSSGTKTLTTQAGLAYVVGSRVRLASSADPSNYMEGVVSSYSSTTLAFTADNSAGSGTLSSWSLSLAGDKGTAGATGSVSAASGVTLAHIATPSPPASGNTTFYSKSDGLLYYRPSGGSETVVGAGAGRTILTGDLTLYVRTDGNNANLGTSNTSGGAFATWQGAIAAYASRYDHAGFNVTIQAGQSATTFTLTSSLILRKAIGTGTLTLDLNGGTLELASSNTANRALIEASAVQGVVLNNGRSVNVRAASVVAWNTHLWMYGGALITANNWNWGNLDSSAAGFSQHILVEENARLSQTGTYTISGGDINSGTSTSAHYNVRFDGLVSVDDGVTVSVSGSPKFVPSANPSLAFATFTSGGKWQGYQVTWGSGIVSGVRKHYALTGGGINMFGLNATYPFPGSVAGTETSPGWLA